MSIHENIQFFHHVNIGEYLDILRVEFDAKEHPAQQGAYLLEGLPFYEPRQSEFYVHILGFNYAPLSSLLITALINHPELAPEDTFVQWTAEQELIVEGTIVELRSRFQKQIR